MLKWDVMLAIKFSAFHGPSVPDLLYHVLYVVPYSGKCTRYTRYCSYVRGKGVKDLMHAVVVAATNLRIYPIVDWNPERKETIDIMLKSLQ